MISIFSDTFVNSTTKAVRTLHYSTHWFICQSSVGKIKKCAPNSNHSVSTEVHEAGTFCSCTNDKCHE